MKKRFFMGMLAMALVLGMTLAACEGKGNTTPRDGTYTFNPRPQATSAGKPVSVYLDKATVSNGYTVFYLTSVSSGRGNLKDIPGFWGTGDSKGTVVLQNLDNQDMSYNDVDAEALYNLSGQYAAFDSIAGYRFSLSCQGERPPIVFNEIVLRKPDEADSLMEKFSYTTPGFDSMDFSVMSFADVIASIQAGTGFDAYFVSEVVFAGQSGTNLTFKTIDGSTAKEMQTKSAPPVLSAGQKVWIYYYVNSQSTRDRFGFNTIREGWAVYAIEKARPPSDFDYGYVLTATGNGVGIEGYHGEDGALVIPAKIDGMPVTAIRGLASSTSLTSVSIHEGVTGISSLAFRGCTGLTDFTVSKQNPVYSSRDGVIFDKKGVVLCLYPAGRKGNYAIPEGVTSIGWDAFFGCTGLTSVTIPKGVTSIGLDAFAGCTGLTSVSIPASVTKIDNNAFVGCTGLTAETRNAIRARFGDRVL